jgi:hypothetical protein
VIPGQFFGSSDFESFRDENIYWQSVILREYEKDVCAINRFAMGISLEADSCMSQARANGCALIGNLFQQRRL